MAKLKPCPFCGGEDLGVSDKTTTINHKRKRHVAVYCKSCRCYGARILGEEIHCNKAKTSYIQQAIEAWNRRAGNE